MGYFGIVMIVCAAIGGLLTLMLFHFVVFMIVGIFKRKTYPQAEEKGRYGVIISARNEEKVIGALIESLRVCDYPQDKLDIFVVAHNCTDTTADVCRAAGATVYEYNNDKERTLGYAYRHLFGKINEDFGTENYDGFLVMNADNVIKKNYLAKMNDAFVALGKKSVVTSYRNSKNFAQNTMSCLYGIFFVAACRYEARGRTVCGCSTRVSGTGYLLPSELVARGWEYVTLTEDWEFTADQITHGRKIAYCDEAEFYDEQPTTMKIMLRQRLRWGKGHMEVFFTRFTRLVKSIFGRKRKGKDGNRFSAYDIAVQILPLGVIGVGLLLVQLVLLAFAPLFGYDAATVWLTYLFWAGVSVGGGYTLTVLSAVFLFLLECKRIGKVGFFTALRAFLLWPAFLLVSVFQDVAVLFIKKLEWKPIPHSGGAAAPRTAAAEKPSVRSVPVDPPAAGSDSERPN